MKKIQNKFTKESNILRASEQGAHLPRGKAAAPLLHRPAVYRQQRAARTLQHPYVTHSLLRLRVDPRPGPPSKSPKASLNHN